MYIYNEEQNKIFDIYNIDRYFEITEEHDRWYICLVIENQQEGGSVRKSVRQISSYSAFDDAISAMKDLARQMNAIEILTEFTLMETDKILDNVVIPPRRRPFVCVPD